MVAHFKVNGILVVVLLCLIIKIANSATTNVPQIAKYVSNLLSLNAITKNDRSFNFSLILGICTNTCNM